LKLSTLLKSIHPLRVDSIQTQPADRPGDDAGRCASDPDIRSIHCRAQDVQPGGLFVAISGLAVDGHEFIDTALDRGAAAVVSEKSTAIKTDAATVRVKNSRAALATLAAQFYGHPSEKLTIIGITGTNGKTTISYLVEQILQAAGLAVGVIGTINYRFNDRVYDNPVTTPESLDLQRILARMKAEGITHVVMEVSSHALDLYRVDACWMDVGVFTNLTQDHLDYHKDMAAYWACKKKLFTEILRSGPKKGHTRAVINCHDPKSEELTRLDALQKITVGPSAENTLWAERIAYDGNGISGRIATPRGSFEFRSELVGGFNRENILCAAGVGIALNLARQHIKNGIESVALIPGRLEAVANTSRRFVYVDYAHTPDALENAISALAAIAREKMICVFGCGGDRDRAKRPQMGEIAGRLCDLAIVTSDNPRSEPPLVIIDQIVAGVRNVCKKQYQPSEILNGFEQKGFVVEPDREQAIRLAIATSRPDDTVLIAGKGHETYQILGDKTIAFDDRQQAAAALAEN
jgi:UDP-N-acetylmuramyl-tripeptide synthetase